ncbi:MAG: Zn-ribbon domain-containing OB-fold protein [Acidimicrobiales bacterium]
MKLEYPYTRTPGPMFGPFLTGLRDGKVLGQRCGSRVLCPPLEYDPDTGATLEPDFVEVGPGGSVESWTWVAAPTHMHPFDHPFAFAQVRLDGADTTMIHAIDAGSIDAMSTGMRVAAQYRNDRKGAVTDVYFVPEADAVAQDITPGDEPVAITEHFISLDIHETLTPVRRRFNKGLQRGVLIGQKSPVTGLIYIPSRGYDAMERVRMGEEDEVEVDGIGAVSSFTVITPIDYYGQEETEPYIRASILLDGTDSPLIGIDIRDIPIDEFRVGMRLRAVWREESERDIEAMGSGWGAAWDAVIERWEPTGEPDVDSRPLQQYAF